MSMQDLCVCAEVRAWAFVCLYVCVEELLDTIQIINLQKNDPSGVKHDFCKLMFFFNVFFFSTFEHKGTVVNLCKHSENTICASRFSFGCILC